MEVGQNRLVWFFPIQKKTRSNYISDCDEIPVTYTMSDFDEISDFIRSWWTPFFEASTWKNLHTPSWLWWPSLRLHDLHAHLWCPQPFLRVQHAHLAGQQTGRSPGPGSVSKLFGDFMWDGFDNLTIADQWCTFYFKWYCGWICTYNYVLQMSKLVGGLVAINFIFPFILGESHHPNWRTPSFFRGVFVYNHQAVNQYPIPGEMFQTASIHFTKTSSEDSQWLHTPAPTQRTSSMGVQVKVEQLLEIIKMW